MDIHNQTELNAVLTNNILSGMIKWLSEKIVNEVWVYMFKNENKAISTKTARKYLTYELKKDVGGYTTTIYIDDSAMQAEEEAYTYGQYSKFMSLGLKSTWETKNGGDGLSISYHLIEWLEETGTWQIPRDRKRNNPIGNNPFPPIGMFKNVFKTLESEIPQWINQYARKIGVSVVR